MLVSRDTLYAEVWAEPMTTVAASYTVSSSYLARVCRQLKVPCPARGYWAAVQAGKRRSKPRLRDPKPGAALDWCRGAGPSRRAPLVGQTARRVTRRFGPRPEVHPLVSGTKELFTNSWPPRDSGYLRPRKRVLPDVFCSEPALEGALRAASELYLALEDRGHRIAFGPASRPDVDHRQVKPKEPPGYYGLWDTWTPARSTVVTMSGFEIGLSLYELSQSVEMRYLNGKYVPAAAPEAQRGRTRGYWPDWTTKRDVGTGRLVFRAFSANHRVTWQREWTEAKAGDLVAKAKRIVRELEAEVPALALRLDQARQEAEVQRQKWLKEQEERERREAEQQRIREQKELERRQAQAVTDSRNQLLAIVERWALAHRIDSFFEEAARSVAARSQDEAAVLANRLGRARQLLGETDPLRHFDTWRSPQERESTLEEGSESLE